MAEAEGPGCQLPMIGSKVASGLGRCADGAAAPSDSERCGLPHEPVRVGEGPGIAAHREPVRSGAVGRDAGDLGGDTAVQSEGFGFESRGPTT
jgi:hypothetical protein